MKGNATEWKAFSLGGKSYRARKERSSAPGLRGALRWHARIEQQAGEEWRPYAIGQWTGECIKEARTDGASRASQPAGSVISAAELALMDRYTGPRRRLEIAGSQLTPARLEALRGAARALSETRPGVVRRLMDALGDKDPERALGAIGREIRQRRAG